MANDMTALSGLFMRKYHKKVVGTLPGGHLLQQWTPNIAEAHQLGEKFYIPVVLGTEQGVTYSKPNNGAFALKAAVDSEIKQAEIESSQFAFRSQMSWEAIRRSLSSTGAVDDVLGRVSMHLRNRARKAMEETFMWGQTERGVVSGVASLTVTLTDASWCGPFWSMAKNMGVTFFSADRQTKRVETTITSVDPVTKKITVAAVTGIVATDLVYPTGAMVEGATPTYHESIGLFKQLTTITGTLFGLDYGVNDCLRGNVIGVNGPLSFSEVNKAAAIMTDRMWETELELDLLVSPRIYANLNADAAALRVTDSSYKPGEFNEGHRVIKYHTPAGVIRVRSYPYMTIGNAIMLNSKNLIRVGSTDLTFNQMHAREGKTPTKDMMIFENLVDNAGAQIKAYGDSAVFYFNPMQSVVFTGITDA